MGIFPGKYVGGSNAVESPCSHWFCEICWINSRKEDLIYHEKCPMCSCDFVTRSAIDIISYWYTFFSHCYTYFVLIVKLIFNLLSLSQQFYQSNHLTLAKNKFDEKYLTVFWLNTKTALYCNKGFPTTILLLTFIWVFVKKNYENREYKISSAWSCMYLLFHLLGLENSQNRQKYPSNWWDFIRRCLCWLWARRRLYSFYSWWNGEYQKIARNDQCKQKTSRRYR
jgi:hypothetical protein